MHEKEFMNKWTYIQRLLRNPVFGLAPFLLFSFLLDFVNPQTAILVGFTISALARIGIKSQSRIVYDVSAITFALAFLIFYFSRAHFTEANLFLLVEVLLVLCLIVYRLSRAKIVHRLSRNTTPTGRYYVQESFRVAFQTQYGLSIHILLIFVILTFGVPGRNFFDTFIVKTLAQIFILIVMFLQLVRDRILNRKLQHEEWLPVVNEFGGVTGKIARSVTQDMKNKYMHPVVRVALIHDKMLYLKPRHKSRLLNPDMLDYPFEKYMHFNHKIEEAVQNSIRKECGDDALPIRFLLKYVFENNCTKRLIFLYASIIDDKAAFEKLHLDGGKLWTLGQIEDNLGNDIFSECFELEFEYLKNTVLLTNNSAENQVIA